jgi:hypothetical protein
MYVTIQKSFRKRKLATPLAPEKKGAETEKKGLLVLLAP